MPIKSMKFRGYRCFATEWAGFDEYKPVNVIIGRNNVGKSQLLDLVNFACKGWPRSNEPNHDFQLTGSLDEQGLRNQFLANTSGGELGGNHWSNHGAHFVDIPFVWERNRHASVERIHIDGNFIAPPDQLRNIELTNARLKKLGEALGALAPPLSGYTFRHLLADRDIQTESATNGMHLAPNGVGATNVIRRHITSSVMKRELVQDVLLSALNEIFGADGHFTEIQTRQHDDAGATDLPWEIYLGQKHKGLIPLSGSGSDLKTVILVLLHLLVMPENDGKSASNSIYAFEELENNLHPALLRRLFTYIERFTIEHQTYVFLTTHSNVALDIFGSSESAQIVHVTHDGETARTATVRAHFDKLGVIAELGARPADLLQANGIIWVEGPSDAIYLNRWIELMSGGRFREGQNYVCAFYGGSLLARTQFVGPENAENEFVNLLLINPNIVVICDGDRTSRAAGLKPRVQRIRKELDSVPGSVLWVTQPKEIEGYLSGELLSRALGLPEPVRDSEQYELIFPKTNKDGSSYVEAILKRSSIDKIELAAKCALGERQDFAQRFDWEKRMVAVVDAIARWNQ